MTDLNSNGFKRESLNSDHPDYKKPKKANFYSVGERPKIKKIEFYLVLNQKGNFVNTKLMPEDFKNVLHFGRQMCGVGMHDKFIAYQENPQISYVFLGRLN